MTERLRSGLQNRVNGFDSHPGLPRKGEDNRYFGFCSARLDFGDNNCYTASQFSAIYGDFFMFNAFNISDWKSVIFARGEVILRGKFPMAIKELAWQAVRFAVACGKSNPLSFALRPVASHPWLKSMVGGVLVCLVMTVAVGAPVSVPAMGEESMGGPVVLAATMGEAEMDPETREAVMIPLKNYHLTQKFWILHSGIDLAAESGELIRPVMNGKVVKIEKNWYGYGNLVIVAHSQEYESWYAHMSQMDVKEGQEVDTNTILGKVGSTGRSTGPHLHLEIRENGIPINPGLILGIK